MMCFLRRRAELWAFAAAHNVTVTRVEGHFHRENFKRRRLRSSSVEQSELDAESAPADSQYDDDDNEQQAGMMPVSEPPAQTAAAAVMAPARYVIAAPAPLSAHTGSQSRLVQLRTAYQFQPLVTPLLSLASSNAVAADCTTAAASSTTAAAVDSTTAAADNTTAAAVDSTASTGSAAAAVASSNEAVATVAATTTHATESTAASGQNMQAATPDATAGSSQQQPEPAEQLTLATAVAHAAAVVAAAEVLDTHSQSEPAIAESSPGSSSSSSGSGSGDTSSSSSGSSSSGKQRPPWFTAEQTLAVGLKFDEWGGLLRGRKADVALLAASLGLTTTQINERFHYVRKLLRVAARRGAPANVGSSSCSNNRNSVTSSSGTGSSPELAALAAARAALQKLLLDAAGMLYSPMPGQKAAKALATLRVCDASRLRVQLQKPAQIRMLAS
jgi:hypothetical protein